MNAVDHNNVVIFDDRGIPSIMCRFVRPKDTEEVPAVFKIGDKVADAIYISKYPNIVIDGRAYSMPSLTIYLSAFLGVNPKKMQDKIDKYRKKGKILTLIIGGKKYGSQWVITGHSKDYEKFDNQGNLLIAKSTLSLEQYAKR